MPGFFVVRSHCAVPDVRAAVLVGLHLPQTQACSTHPACMPAGGAVVRMPHDALPEHLQALVALLSGRCGAPPPPGQRSGVNAGLEDAPREGDPKFFLRCLHLDLSGQAVPTALLGELLASGPVREEGKSLTTLRGLELRGCQLAAGAAGVASRPGA